jgi:hypothetical protein
MSACPTRSQCEDNFAHSLLQTRRIFALEKELERLTDELHLAHEALKREFVDKGITDAVAQ